MAPRGETDLEFDITAPIPPGAMVLEASAGTGKTWTIAAIATRLIAEGEIDVEDLLVITYTRAAAKELRSRIRARLRDTARALRGPTPGASQDPLVASLADSADAPELGTRIDRLERAVAEIDSATIATIHGFFQTVLQGIGVGGDVDEGFDFRESIDELRAEVVEDAYLRMFGRGPIPPPLTLESAGKLARAVTDAHFARIEPQGVDGEDPVTGARVEFARTVRGDLRDRKAHLGVAGYNDLLTELASAVLTGAPEDLAAVRGRLRARWRLVLVDEFQDTDEIQWRILEAVFTGRLILIGDPKQAIYRFRGGDIATYLKAVEGTRTFTLAKNYRSDPPLVEALNTLLRDAELGDPRIRVHDVSAGRPDVSVRHRDGDFPRVRIRVVDPGGFRLTSLGYPSVPDLRAAIARDVALDISHLLADGYEVCDPETGTWRPVKAADVAVLCHHNSHVEAVHDELALLGINGVRSGGANVFTSEAADEWLTLLEAIEQPSTSARVGACAIGPFFGYDAVQLAEEGDRVWDDVTTRLQSWGELLLRSGAGAVLEDAQGAGSGSMLIRLLAHADGERLVADLRHLADLMQGAHPATGATALALWLRNERKDSAHAQDLRRLQSDASAVTLSTIHKAKGLQYPFVYLPTIGMEAGRSDSIPVIHDGQERIIDLNAKTPAHIKEQMKAELEGEQLRLAYVALTRAQGQVTTYWAPKHLAERTPLHRIITRGGARVPPKLSGPEIIDHLTALCGAQASIELVRDRAPRHVAEESAEELTGARRATRQFDTGWRRTSYTALSEAAERDGPGIEDASAPGPLPDRDNGLRKDEEEITITPSDDGSHVPSLMADLPKGARFGSLVHAVLETTDRAATDLGAEISTRVTEQLPLWPMAADPDLLATAIHGVLTTPLGPVVGTTLAGLNPREQLAELDFDLPLDGGDRAGTRDTVTLRDLAPILRRHLQEGDPLRGYAEALDTPAAGAQGLRGYLTGSIDLVFRAGGRYFVADYKTNWLGPAEVPLTTAAYTPARLSEAMVGSSYPLQALLYGVALHRYLRWRVPDYDPATHIGGVLYLYVRGMAGPDTPTVAGQPCGVFTWRPPAGLLTELSDLLDGTGDRR